ncbi:MAG: RnfH family protein [Emcibacter sp.]|nr:RnfH family protein [Emcibacter sp.]
MIQVGVAYATSIEQAWHEVNVHMGATVREVIEESRILDQFPDINLKKQKVGIFGKVVELDTMVSNGDRVEIYRAIIIDPEVLEPRQYRLRKMDIVIERGSGAPGEVKISKRKD